MEPEGSLPHSQELATCPYPELSVYKDGHMYRKRLMYHIYTNAPDHSNKTYFPRENDLPKFHNWLRM
jgi:hypothetical protein